MSQLNKSVKIRESDSQSQVLEKHSSAAGDSETLQNSSSNSPKITCTPFPCVFDTPNSTCFVKGRFRGDRSPSPDKLKPSSRFGKRATSPINRKACAAAACGYEQYQKSLLDVPVFSDYGDASSDDLSSEWDSDAAEVLQHVPSQKEVSPKIMSQLNKSIKCSENCSQTLEKPKNAVEDASTTDVCKDFMINLSNSSKTICTPPEGFDISSCARISSSRQTRRGGRSTSSAFKKRTSSPHDRKSSAGATCGYDQYQNSLIDVSIFSDYGDGSSDDLSSEWDSDNAEVVLVPHQKPSGWRKLRNIVQWTPFFQTYKKQSYPWVQLAGHQGNFKAGPDPGTILKKLSVKEERCFKILMNDVLRPYVPEYKGQVTSSDGDSSYIQLQDLLSDFNSPCVMDCKIGVRTYLEEELAKAKEKPKLRKDMYEKMIQIDPIAPTEEEHRLKAVTKPRYMVWRETISSTAMLGFRIEGLRRADGTSTKDFKTTKTKEQVMEVFSDFTDSFPHAIPKYIQRLKAIKDTLETSQFFRSHEVIGSSLLFVHDRYNANVWLIDFAKTLLLPDEITIDHNTYWKVGNHEDGYLIGINNLINIFVKMLDKQRVCITPPLSLQDPIEHQPENDLIKDET